MSLIWFDGFDIWNTYTEAALYGKYTFSTTTHVFEGGHKAGKSLRNVTDGSYMRIVNDGTVFPTGSMPWSGIFGLWFKFTDTAETTPSYIMRIAGTTVTNPHVSIVLNGSEQIQIGYRGLFIGSTVLEPNIYYHAELQYQIANVTTIPNILKINGVTVASLPVGSDTFNDTYPTLAYIDLHCEHNVNYDHCYLLDLQGSEMNSFLGPYTYIRNVRPTGNGETNSWSIFPATGLHWDAVNDDVIDTTSYTYTSTSGNTELFKTQPVTGDIRDILVIRNNVFAKSDGFFQDLALKGVSYISGVEYTQLMGTGLTAGWQYLTDTMYRNPANNEPWTTGVLNTSQFGYKLHYTGV